MTGGELDAAYTPLPGLTLRTGLAVLNSEINQIALPDGVVTTRKTAQSPHISLTGDISYSWTPSFGGTIVAGTDFSYRTSYYYDLLDSPAALQSAYWLQDLHVEYTTEDGHWSVQGYADNLFDKHYLTNVIPVGPAGWSQGVYGMPLTFGFRLGYHVQGEE